MQIREASEKWILPVIIRKEIRAKYYEALDKAMASHDYTEFVKLVVAE